MSHHSYVVEYCSSCDGGHQEEQTAMSAIREAAGADAKITSVVSDDYPIIVTVRTDDGKILWKNSQKKLYRKYPVDRGQSIQEIQEAVRKHLKG